MIDAEYRTIPGDRALYGHSQGGSFAFYSLLHGEGAFSRFIIGSPSLWWDDVVAFEFERQFAEEHRALPARVFFAVGLLETDKIHEPVRNGRVISNLRDLVAVLEERQYEGLVLETHFLEDENHQSVIPGTISRGLRHIYGEDR